MQQKGIQYKIVHIKSALNVKTDNVKKINKSILHNFKFSQNTLSENGIIFVSTDVFLRSKTSDNFLETSFFKNEAACVYVNMRKYITSRVPILWQIAFNSYTVKGKYSKNSTTYKDFVRCWRFPIFSFLGSTL